MDMINQFEGEVWGCILAKWPHFKARSFSCVMLLRVTWVLSKWLPQSAAEDSFPIQVVQQILANMFDKGSI